MPCARPAPPSRTGMPEEPSAKHGAQSSPSEGERVERVVGGEETRCEGAGRGVPAGNADVSGGPTARAASRDIGIDAVVGRVPRSGNSAAVHAVENATVRLRDSRGRVLARHQVGLDVVAGRVVGGHQLVGAAVQQQRGSRLLSCERVRARIFDRCHRRRPVSPKVWSSLLTVTPAALEATTR